MNQSYKKYLAFFLVILAGLFLDQWSKDYAAARLATQRASVVDHPLVFQIEEADAGKSLKSFLSEEFTSNSPEEIQSIASHFTLGEDGRGLSPTSELSAGQKITVTNRKVVVIQDYWDFQYTENPGAAFGLLADGHEDWRVPFFITVSLLAVLMILYILRSVRWEQQLMVWGLSFIAAGALGNFIDRIRFGYVIDFIVWKYTDAYRWPTFNIADAFICIGVGLMAIELIRDLLSGPATLAAGEDTAEKKEQAG